MTRNGSRGLFPKLATGLNVHFMITSGHLLANYMSFFFTKLKFRRSSSAPQNDHLNFFSFVKNFHVLGEKMSRKGQKTVMY